MSISKIFSIQIKIHYTNCVITFVRIPLIVMTSFKRPGWKPTEIFPPSNQIVISGVGYFQSVITLTRINIEKIKGG